MSLERSLISGDLLNQLALPFEWHAKNIYGISLVNSSPLYAQLSLEIASDPAILSLVAKADLSQQVSNLLLGAVHFLLLNGIPSPLADYYPSLTPNPRPRQEAYPYFRAFCLEHADLIRRLVTTRRGQTNEVHRCTALLPAFGVVAEYSGSRPLALVEIGASAGLHMLWDRYGYDYGEAGDAGNKNHLFNFFVLHKVFFIHLYLIPYRLFHTASVLTLHQLMSEMRRLFAGCMHLYGQNTRIAPNY